MISTKYLDWKLIPRKDPDAGAVRRGLRYAESVPAGRAFPTLYETPIFSKPGYNFPIWVSNQNGLNNWDFMHKKWLNSIKLDKSAEKLRDFSLF